MLVRVVGCDLPPARLFESSTHGPCKRHFARRLVTVSALHLLGQIGEELHVENSHCTRCWI